MIHHPVMSGTDDDNRRLASIKREFEDHAGMTVLRQANLTGEAFAILERRTGIDGHVVPKKARGRPKGTIARAARELKVKGETEEARRKTVRRLLKIATIHPDAQEAAVAKGLSNNQAALLRVSKQSTPEEQLGVIHEIAGQEKAGKGEKLDRRIAVLVFSDGPSPAEIAHQKQQTAQFAKLHQAELSLKGPWR